LVDFNQLEHVLDDAPHTGAWMVELRKANDDPLELDEIVLHVQKLNGVDETQLTRELNNRFVLHTELHPNRIVFHSAGEMRELQGVGRLIKEQKIIDHRPTIDASSPTRPVERPDSPDTDFGSGNENTEMEELVSS
jgi:hypothetical protein